ncbi:MAG TPA: glycosyltransferase family 4 protein [Stellaceae bacterium]|nr:glycosyltransferase family 4 protein [Stellaceae bacterium]
MEAILVSDYGDARGGAAKVAIMSARALASRGIPVTFFCATPPDGSVLDHPLVRVECVGIEDVWHRSPFAAAVGGIANRRAAETFAALLRQADPARTILHFHQWTKALSPSVLRVAAKTPFAALVTAHDYLAVCPNGTFFDHGTGSPCSLRPLSVACALQRCDARSQVHKAVRLMRQADLPALWRRVGDRWGFIHISPGAAEVARPFLPETVRHFTILDPVDATPAPPVRVSGNRDFLYLGRLVPEKGCVDLATAAADGFGVSFMGEGPQEQAILAANSHARILPWGDAEAVDRAIGGARALVLPSIWQETFGMVVAEALARGVPAIVSDRVGALTLIDHGGNGLIYPAGDRAALRRCLAILSDDQRAAAMGREAYDRYWAAPLSVSAHADALVQAYGEMLSTAPVGARPMPLPTLAVERTG